MSRIRILFAARVGSIFLIAGLAPYVANADEFPIFKSVTLDPNIGNVCYAVTIADVDGDSRPDIVAVTENRVLWFQAPKSKADFLNPEKWQRFTIIENQTEKDNVCIAAHDIDGDGKIDFALGAGWTKKGTIQWLSRGKSLPDKWTVHEIGVEPWLHRMSFADVLGKGKPQLVISPLNKTKAKGVRLTAFEIPKNPRTDRWLPTILDQEQFDRLHNHTHLDLAGLENDTVETIVANKTGTVVVARGNDDWSTKQLSDQASGEIKFGKLPGGQRFFATIEPMHGTKVAVYTSPPKKAYADKKAFDVKNDALWNRTEIENELAGGHALVTADLDGQKGDEIVVGHRLAGKGAIKGPGLYVYQLIPNPTDQPGMFWKKHVIDDGGIAVEDATCCDLNGDGRIDIIAGGRATHNLKIYVNQQR